MSETIQEKMARFSKMGGNPKVEKDVKKEVKSAFEMPKQSSKYDRPEPVSGKGYLWALMDDVDKKFRDKKSKYK